MHVLSFVLIIAIATKIAVKMKQSHVMSSTLIGVTLMKVNMHVGFSVNIIIINITMIVNKIDEGTVLQFGFRYYLCTCTISGEITHENQTLAHHRHQIRCNILNLQDRK